MGAWGGGEKVSEEKRGLLAAQNSDNEVKQIMFPLKMPDCCVNLLFLPCGWSSPGGGWFSGWSQES